MQDIDFFIGQRPLTKTVFFLHKGKATLTCTPWEEWKLIEPCPFTLRCGNKREQTLTQRWGIEQTQQQSFESTIGGSLGEKGIAAIESSLKSTLGEEIKFQMGTESQQTFSFDSPACGYKLVKLYQKVRSLHIKYEDRRFWHREAVEFTLTQWLKSIYDATVVEQDDPQCNCKSTSRPANEFGIAARISFGNAAKLAVQRTGSNQLEFPERADALNSYFTWGRDVTGHLPTELLPDYLRFLAGLETGTQVEASAWQESTLFAMHPEFVHGAPEVTVVLNDSFEQVEQEFVLQPVGFAPATEEDVTVVSYSEFSIAASAAHDIEQDRS